MSAAANHAGEMRCPAGITRSNCSRYKTENPTDIRTGVLVIRCRIQSSHAQSKMLLQRLFPLASALPAWITTLLTSTTTPRDLSTARLVNATSYTCRVSYKKCLHTSVFHYQPLIACLAKQSKTCVRVCAITIHYPLPASPVGFRRKIRVVAASQMLVLRPTSVSMVVWRSAMCSRHIIERRVMLLPQSR